MLESPGIIVAPGAYDGISARVIEQAGFTAAYMTGAGVSGSMVGHADIGLTTMTEMAAAARNIAQVLSIPLLCDADTGYGNPLNAIRTVHEYEMAGVAAIQLEDQQLPKRCGHLGGKVLVSGEESWLGQKAQAPRVALTRVPHIVIHPRLKVFVQWKNYNSEIPDLW